MHGAYVFRPTSILCWCTVTLFTTSSRQIKSLNEKIAMSRRNMKSRYQRKLVPLGTKSIMKEERCYLPDGSMIELRDTWTMDSQEDATEE